MGIKLYELVHGITLDVRDRGHEFFEKGKRAGAYLRVGGKFAKCESSGSLVAIVLRGVRGNETIVIEKGKHELGQRWDGNG